MSTALINAEDLDGTGRGREGMLQVDEKEAQVAKGKGERANVEMLLLGQRHGKPNANVS